MFKPLPSKFDFPAAEKAVLEFWDKHGIFQKSIENRRRGDDTKRFVFYEGPPTANGLPHPGHALTRAIKDLFPRYRTMTGHLVERKAGWDTHGLPVEVEVCKELGIHTKEEIEAYGVEKFNLKCIQSVFRYTREWEELTRRLGFWVNLSEAYVTYHQSYVESVWWGLKTLFERGLLYQGHKVVWWWCQGGTALSSGEVGEGYRKTDDPSVFVKFPVVGKDRTALLVWTTTPWTLISNHFAAVNPELDYALVEDSGDGQHGPEFLYVAAALVETLGKKVKRELRVVSTCRGAELVGMRYLPPFPDCYYNGLLQASDSTVTHDGENATRGHRKEELKNGGADYVGWRVLPAQFVTIDSGTGLVHEAPAFGEVDYEVLQTERERFKHRYVVDLLCAVAPNGTFNHDAPERYRGRWIKDCDKDIIRDLKERGLLWHQEQYNHDYPFCPRASEDPLIQYARKSWFVRTSQFKDEFLKNNDTINWLPDHIQEGRFGDFLRNNVDWALSRERYWGTPLPVWQCPACNRMEAIGSFPELTRKTGATDNGYWDKKVAEHQGQEFPDHLRVHKPYIDEWTYECGKCAAGTRMKRVPEVIDCWWDSGSMPFAQWGFPHAPGSVEKVAERLPADFISEALDQTRGWFYGLLSISTMLRESIAQQTQIPRAFPLPYRNCVVLGLILGEDGTKMSKRLKNYKEPSYIFDTYGADAMRWYFFSAQAPWTSVRFQEGAIRDSQREFLVKLYNVISFFTIYANIDGFVPHPKQGSPWRPTKERGELDRWLVSELQRTTQFVREKMDAFENFPAAQRLNEFVEALSNWYVRRSRERFWRAEKDQDKWDAYHTLYGVLWSLSKLIAPFTPFFAETMYQTLTGDRYGNATAGGPIFADQPLSVHLCDYPELQPKLIESALADEMELVRSIVSLGRAARTDAKIKVRQPLERVEIILAKREHEDWLRSHAPLIAEELNVKTVEFTAQADAYVTYEVKPNFKALGPKFGALAPKIKQALTSIDAAAARRDLVEAGQMTLKVGDQSVNLTQDEVEIRLAAKPGWAAAQGRFGVVVLATQITPALADEGRVNELIHHVQALRKDRELAYTARIALTVDAPDALAGVIRTAAGHIGRECLAQRVEVAPVADAAAVTVEIDDLQVKLDLQVLD